MMFIWLAIGAVELTVGIVGGIIGICMARSMEAEAASAHTARPLAGCLLAPSVASGAARAALRLLILCLDARSWWAGAERPPCRSLVVTQPFSTRRSSQRLPFILALVSSSTSVIVGVVWLVCSITGKLNDFLETVGLE